MANGNYTLTIKLVTDDKQQTAKEVGGAGGINSDTTGGEVSQEQDKTASTLLKKVVGYGTIKSFANQAITHYVSTVQLRTGSNEAQQRANFTYSLAQQGLGIAETIAAGAFAGGGIGAAIGAVMSVAHTAISWQQKQNVLDMQRNLEFTSQNYGAQRATYSGSRYQTVLQE